MEWIKQHKTHLNALQVISVIAIVAFLFYLRSVGEISNLEQWEMGLIILPWAFFGGSFFPLMYLSWFKANHGNITNILLKLLFLVLFVSYFWVFVAIYGIIGNNF